MSKFLVNLFMFKTRLIVNTYTVTTLPLYYAIQKPWKALEISNKIRSKKFIAKNGEVIWTHNDGQVISHPLLDCGSYAEMLGKMNKLYEPNRETLGKRDVISDKIAKDENGNVIKMNGKVLRKYVLSESYYWFTLKQVLGRIDNIAKGLHKSGVKKGDTVVIWADTSLEWFISALALMKINATLSTLYTNLGNSGIIFGLNQTEAKTIITTIDLLPKLKSLHKEVANIERIVYIKNKNDVLDIDFPQNIAIKSLEEVETEGERVGNKFQFELPNTNDIAVIMYTSGTTGNPKAVCLTHKQLIESQRTVMTNGIALVEEALRHTAISYLPLAHMLGFTFDIFLFFVGIRIGYSSPLTLTDTSPGLSDGQKGDIQLVQPTFMASVPLVLDRMLKEIYNKLNARSAISAPLFTYLMEYKIYWKSKGYDTPIINKLFCEKIRQALGGKVESIVVGGAPLSPRTQELIKAAFNVKVNQGYGATEVTGAAIANHVDDDNAGTVGRPLDGVTIKLVDWPEGGYCTTDKPNPRGEIVIGNEIVGEGYYKLPEQTKEVFTTDSEGKRWFYTGDIGEVLPDGNFRIIDRKKDLTKLPNGEYISVGKIEAALKGCPIVDNICIVCDNNVNHVNALVTPDNKALLNLAKELGKPDTYTKEQLCNDPDVYEKVYECIVKSAKINHLHRIEIPLRIKICAEEWSTENNLITAAFKLKRNVIMSYYKNEIQKLFE